MKYCYVEQIKEAEQIWFVVCETDSMNILLEPTKYLKHKTREHCSPNTVKKIAYGIVDIEELANRIVCKLEERQIVIKESGLKAEMKATNSIEKSGEEDIYKKALSFIDTL